MEPRKRLGAWRWVLGILGVIAVVGVVLIGLAVALTVFGVVKLGEALSTETDAKIKLVTDAGRPAFDMEYGKDVTGLTAFVVTDADGTERWRRSGGGDGKPARVVYGEGDQKPPPDIRGKHVKVEASCRFVVAFGAGHQSTYAEFDVPQ